MPGCETVHTPAQPELRLLHDLWQQKRGARLLPSREDFDPKELKFALGRLLLLDVLPGPRFRFRLHGSKLTEVAGYDMTGRYADDLPDPENRETLLARCARLVHTREPINVSLRRPLQGRRFHYDALWLPLGKHGAIVDMLMCCLIYLDNWAQATPEDLPFAGARSR